MRHVGGRGWINCGRTETGERKEKVAKGMNEGDKSREHDRVKGCRTTLCTVHGVARFTKCQSADVRGHLACVNNCR